MLSYKYTPKQVLKAKGDLGVPYIIFIGAAGAGKDEAAKYFSDAHHAYFYSTSEAIKQVAISYYGMTEEQCYTQKGKSSPHKYLRAYYTDTHAERARWVLQTYEHEVLQPFNGWTLAPMLCREVLEQIGDKMNSLDPLVLVRPMEIHRKATGKTILDTSAREMAQVDWPRDRGGVVVLISRKEAEKNIGAHHTASFYQTVQPDYIIDNNGSIGQLHDQIDALVIDLKDKAQKKEKQLSLKLGFI